MRYVYITLINKCKMLRIIIIRDTKLLISRFVYNWLKIYMVKCIFDIMTIFETAKLNHHYMKTILDHRWTKFFFYKWKFHSSVEKKQVCLNADWGISLIMCNWCHFFLILTYFFRYSNVLGKCKAYLNPLPNTKSSSCVITYFYK